MDSKWRETFLLHSRTEGFQRHIEIAQEIIKNALQKYRKPYIAFSGGKDSTCMMHLVLQQKPDTMILHWDYGRYFIPLEMHQEIIENTKKIGAKNLRIETSTKYERLGREARNIIGTEMIGKLIPQLIEEGYDAVFVGLRRLESLKRKRRINAGRSLTEMPEIFPIHLWSWMDVWAYVISNDLPYLSHYDVYGPVVGWNRVRFTTLFDPEFDKFGCSNVDGILSWKHKYSDSRALRVGFQLALLSPIPRDRR